MSYAREDFEDYPESVSSTKPRESPPMSGLQRSVFAAPFGIAVDPNGNIFASDSSGANVYGVDHRLERQHLRHLREPGGRVHECWEFVVAHGSGGSGLGRLNGPHALIVRPTDLVSIADYGKARTAQFH